MENKGNGTPSVVVSRRRNESIGYKCQSALKPFEEWALIVGDNGGWSHCVQFQISLKHLFG